MASHIPHRVLRICQYIIASGTSQSQSHGVSRHCEEGERSAARRGNPLSLIKVKDLLTYSPIHLFTSKRVAFTLAEVLVTLGVIGIVAAMTIPNLVQSYQEKVTVVKVKKIYNTLSNSYQLAILDYDTADKWEMTRRNVDSGILMRNRLLKNVKTVKVCNNPKEQKACGIADVYYLFDKKTVEEATSVFNERATVSALLADGSTVMTIVNEGESRGTGELSHVYGNIYYDANGIKPPNVYGKDMFMFYLTGNSIIPSGTTNENENFYKFPKGCINKGYGCTAWVIYSGNMDYLHCDDLSWEGKHKCSD